VTRTIPLDPLLVSEWISNSGAQNFGLLFKAVTGHTSIMSNAGTAIAQRPALHLSYSTNPSATIPVYSYPKIYSDTPRAIYVSPTGSDLTGTGHSLFPFASPRKALYEAMPGDTINLLTGVYAGGITIDKPHITLQSPPGQFAVIAAPRNDPISTANVITIRYPAQYGALRNLEITGGYYYGVMFFSDWENFASIQDRVSKANAPTDYILDNLRIHHTGSSCVKMTMKVSRVTLQNAELHHCGSRYRLYGHGVEGVQSHDVTVQDSYVHDVAGAGVHLVGGSMSGLVQRNYFANTNFGLNIGFATAYEYMDPIHNPHLYENLHTVVANNIITQTNQAGINLWAAYNSSIMFNTIWNSQQTAQSTIILNSYCHSDAPNSPVIGCANINIIANILVKADSARVGPVFQIRSNGLDTSSYLNMAANVYVDAKATSTSSFQWGVGAMLEDERTLTSFIGNSTKWASHCQLTLHQSYCDINSIESDPYLSPTFEPLPCSPAIGRFSSLHLPSTPLPLVQDDYHGRTRIPTAMDAGAVSASSSTVSGSVKPFPPVPAAFANIASYNGPGLTASYYNQYEWPYQYWLTRTCQDIYVDAINGNDAQAFNYNSLYAEPFKTIQAALISINQCDRILLTGGQIFPGPFGIYRPNVTIMTNPNHKSRAVVNCVNTAGKNCIMTGSGFYDGAAELTLVNFDIAMSGDEGSGGDCIRLNEGYGGGSSPYWKFYVETSGRKKYSRGRTLISDMDISGCRFNGIKLSTFVSGVIMKNLRIHNVGGTGIEMRNGNDVLVQNCVIENVTSGIVMGGGARSNVVERNTIRHFSDRGIIAGSDNTEVQYMDVDAVEKSPRGSWHDAVNCTIRNNIISHGGGAGLSFYSARDIVAVHNTIFDVASSSQAAVLLNLSPKQIGLNTQIYPPNENITFANNLVIAHGDSNLPMVEVRVMQSTIPSVPLPSETPSDSHKCPIRRYLRQSSPDSPPLSTIEPHVNLHRALPDLSRQDVSPSVPLRNSDGSCQQFPADNAWHADVRSLPVHPNSHAIKLLIGIGSRLHADFGSGVTRNGKYVPYGIPFVTVNSGGPDGQPFVPITIAPTGYPDESDGPLLYPIPPDAPIEGASLNCPDAVCPGDRHVLVVDNATCTLYEMWRSFPPGMSGSSWVSDIAVKFDMSSNKLRPLGYTSSDAAGLPVLPGLVQFDEVINKGVINHALRFTGPNSRAAYSLPATHFAPFGNSGPDSPWMGMRIRLNASYDCSALERASRVFCVALQTYGGIFADNGSPWYFTGEATTNWTPYLSELAGIGKIKATDIEVLDSGCLCLDASCSIFDCGNGATNPSSLPSYSAVTNHTELHFSHNIYWRLDNELGRYTDRKVGYLGVGYDGTFGGWQSYSQTDDSSMEQNPLVHSQTYRLLPNSPAKSSAPLLNDIAPFTDYFGRAVVPANGKVDIGVIYGVDTPPTPLPSPQPTNFPSVKPSLAPTTVPTISPTSLPTLVPSTPSPSVSPTRSPLLSIPPTKSPTSVFPSQKPSVVLSSTTITETFAQGITKTDLNGISANYDGEREFGINTQYMAAWNNNNGVAYPWGSTSSYLVSEAYSSSADKFRLLMKFGYLDRYLPATVVPVLSQLRLTTTNWGPTATLQICFLTKPWNPLTTKQ
jgi:hypothetical protein